MPENLIRCSVCRKRVQEKLAQVTWAWTDGESLRTAVRQRLCTGCFAGRVLVLEKPVEFDSDLLCCGCGISVEDDLRVLYCTAYVPSAGKMTFQFPFCDNCLSKVQPMCRENANVLQEREEMLGGQGQAPQHLSPALAAWRALGIEPNE